MEHTLDVKIKTPIIDIWNKKFIVPVEIEGKEVKEFEVGFGEMEITASNE
jgi:hypothetical protein